MAKTRVREIRNQKSESRNQMSNLLTGGGKTVECGFDLGQKARDTVTGFEGTVVCITFWHGGYVAIGIQPEGIHEGKLFEKQVFDWHHCEPITESPKVQGFGVKHDSAGQP